MEYPFSLVELDKVNIFQLREIAREIGVNSPTSLKRDHLISAINDIITGKTAPTVKSSRGRPTKSSSEPFPLFTKIKEYMQNLKSLEPESKPLYQTREEISQEFQPENNFDEREGILEIHNEGFGFVRVNNCEPCDMDAYLSSAQIRKFGLRKGDCIRGKVKNLHENKYDAMINIISINSIPIEKYVFRRNFEDLLPIYPDQRLRLETENSSLDLAIRCIDLIAPIGKGQRAMIVSPPKAGKTSLLKKIAQSIATNYPDIKLIMLLIDERPEEVTDIQRSVSGEVVFSTFDETPEHHTRAADLVLSRAKRLVESGKDVVILLDSLTRLARAYNLVIEPTGRTLSGGIDPGALHIPKRFFGAARNIENGGSLTIIATALVDTGSRMDDIIYEEFKGTGNMEVHLDRRLSEKRIFPAIDLQRSGTRKEELLLSQKELECMWNIRKLLSNGDSQESIEQLLSLLLRTKNNAAFIKSLDEHIKVVEFASKNEK